MERQASCSRLKVGGTSRGPSPTWFPLARMVPVRLALGVGCSVGIARFVRLRADVERARCR